MKKTICLALCAVILCSVFTSCSAGEEKENKDDSNQPVNELSITIDAHYSTVDESAIRVYEKLCEAVINYETEIKFNTSLTDDVTSLFYTSFPLYALVEGMDFLSDNTGVSISYKLEEEEHTKMVNAFKSAVSEIMNACGYRTVSDSRYLLNLYTYITTNVTIDNSVTTVMDTIINKRGISASVSGMFEYLLLQAGIPACHIMNLDSNSIGMMISMAEFNGGTYYFDPASEIGENQGRGLMFFAMDSERATFSSSDTFVFTDNNSADEIDDDTYSALENCTSYSVDGNTVTAVCRGSEDFTFELK